MWELVDRMFWPGSPWSEVMDNLRDGSHTGKIPKGCSERCWRMEHLVVGVDIINTGQPKCLCSNQIWRWSRETDSCSCCSKCLCFSTSVSTSTSNRNFHFLVQHFSCPTAYVITPQYLFCPSFNLPHLSPGFKANYPHEERNFLDSGLHRNGLLSHFSLGSDSERSKSSTMCALQKLFWVCPLMNINHCVCCVPKSPHSAFALVFFKEMWAQSCSHLHRAGSFCLCHQVSTGDNYSFSSVAEVKVSPMGIRRGSPRQKLHSGLQHGSWPRTLNLFLPSKAGPAFV